MELAMEKYPASENERIALGETDQTSRSDSVEEGFDEHEEKQGNAAQQSQCEYDPHGNAQESSDDSNGREEEEAPALTLPQRYALSMANNPKAHFYSGFCFVITTSVLGMVFGHFSLSVDNKGWFTRGTEIANKASQSLLIKSNKHVLWNGIISNYSEWDDLLDRDLFNAKRNGWETQSTPEIDALNNPATDTKNSTDTDPAEILDEKWGDICDGSWYHKQKYFTDPKELNFNSIWQTSDAESKHPTQTALSADALYNMCTAEERVLKFLEDNDLCSKCPVKDEELISYKCLQPLSLVSMARANILASNLELEGQYFLKPSISCEELRDQWTPEVQTDFTSRLRRCAFKFLQKSNIFTVEDSDIKYHGDFKCLLSQFSPFAVDKEFAISDPPIIKYTASIFAQKVDEKSIQKIHDAYSRGGFDEEDNSAMSGLYEVGFNSLYSSHRLGFYERTIMSVVVSDVLLCVLCAVVTSICILIHTKSPLLTMVGLFQIILSFPVSYAIYYFVCGIPFFPFVNMNALFVVFALGADDIFVAVDKWKNVRAELGNGTTKQVAIAALPSASFSMFVTSATTGSAFFASAISPVPAMVCFSVFCGLVVTVDYILNILLVFPTLIVFDELLMAGSTSKFVSFEKYRGEIQRKEPLVKLVSATSRTVTSEYDADSDTPARVESSKEDHIFIHRVLECYYTMVHKFRWPILLLSLAALAYCGYVASLLDPTGTQEIPFFNANHPLEMHRDWSKKLLPDVLSGVASSTLYVVYGVIPMDTGDHIDPNSFTSLVLDESFNPKSEEVQTYMLGVCDRLYQNDFSKEVGGIGCSLKAFHDWLVMESNSTTPSEEYQRYCKGSTSVPVSPDIFDQCIIAWEKLIKSGGVLEYHGEVKIIVNLGLFDSSFATSFLEKEAVVRKFTAWEENEREIAPAGLNFFVTSIDSWWYDTLSHVLNSAYITTGIAVSVAALMIIVTSQSISIMVYSCVSILYVVLGATASLVGLGWTLGLFESILFAILIGIGCDFCLHLGHAYTLPSGEVSKEDRTRFALLHMGPSILASGLTTILTAFIMLFTTMSFFRQFSVMLIMTMLHSIIGSFVVFVVICDCFGPSDPKFVFRKVNKVFWCKNRAQMC